MADDVLIASLALLATSWAGVTFATNGGANTAISNLLQSKPAVKLSLAGLITKKLVVEGTKLLLTRDVRDAFETVLPEIKSFFQTESDVVSSENTGSLCGFSVVGCPFPLYSDRPDISFYYPVPAAPFVIFVSDSVSFAPFYIEVTPSAIHAYSSYSDGVFSGGLGYSPLSGTSFAFYLCPDSSGKKAICISSLSGNTISTNVLRTGLHSPQFTLLSASNSIPFQTSKEVDGTSALEILKPAPLYVVNPDGNEGGDGSLKPEINFKYGMLALEGLIGAITLGGQEAQKDKDPGLKPDEMVNDLQQAMNSAGQNPNPNPNPEPRPNPEPEPAPDPDTPGGEGTPPQFNQMVIPNLKDFFPFCIPGDIKKMIDALCATPEAPKFTFATSFMGQVYSVNIDLSPWNGVAASVRYMVVAVYIAALAVATRKFIKW